MKVLEQCFCPLCLLPPLFLCYCIYAPAQVQQHVPSALSCTPFLTVLPAFLSNCLTHRDNRTQSAFQVKEKSSPITEVASLHGCVCVSVVFFPTLYALTAMLYFVFHSVFSRLYVFSSVYSRLHVWMHNTTTQTNILLLHPSHYSFAEGFAALLQFVLLYESSFQL